MKKNVLVTAIGTITATNIIRALRKKGDYIIFGADINEQKSIATSKDVDEFFVFPSAVIDEDKYIKFVLNFCEEKEIDYYFAVIDKEVVSASKHKNDFLSIGTKVCVPNTEFVNTVHYKDIFANWVEKNFPDISIRTYDRNIDSNISFPVFVKPIEGVASSGCRKIDTREEFETFWLKANRDNYLVQEYVEGNHYTVDIARNKTSNQIVQVQRKELLRNANGCGIAVEIVENPYLHYICEQLMIMLDLNGVVNAEFFEADNHFYIIEINPRFSAGNWYSFLSGVDFVECAINIASEENFAVYPNNVSVGKRYAERYEIYEMN